MELTQITGKTCCRKIQSMTSCYNEELLEHCRTNCIKTYDETCPFYLPIEKTEMPFRMGGLAFKLGEIR